MKKKSYAVSSSDEDPPKKTEKPSVPINVEDNEQIKEILKNNKVRKLNFKNWKSCNTLFYDEITSDDEVYLVQCPKNTDVTSLSNANVDFDSVVSTIKCLVNESKEKLTVYSVEDFPSRLNLTLPNRATKSFQLKSLPVAGQLVMQKNIKTRPIKIKSESSCIDLDPPSPVAEEEIIDEIKSESPSSKKRRS